MLDHEFTAIIGTEDKQLAHARACLDLFEKDRGRRAHSMLEIRNWADVQDPENLRFRILRRVRADQDWNKACKRIWKDVPASLAPRPPIGQRTFVTLAEAVKLTGRSRAEILGAVGQNVDAQDGQGAWQVDRAALCRAFPPVQAAAAKSDTTDDEALDAVTLVLEVEISTAIREAGDKLRSRRMAKL